MKKMDKIAILDIPNREIMVECMKDLKFDNDSLRSARNLERDQFPCILFTEHSQFFYTQNIHWLSSDYAKITWQTYVANNFGIDRMYSLVLALSEHLRRFERIVNISLPKLLAEV
jgi:hypothetical protein